MSKLIAEADKLLEKGKIPEALEKLKAAQKAEPLNQLVATKLANAYVDNGEIDKAVKVFIALADRLSEAGKAQVAIAIYKQALELDPTDVGLKVKFAIECEAAGKLSDAQTNANFALKHYLKRKKYFDAANLMPMLVRIQGKDEKLKETWIEILQLSQADQKLIHLLVALCGPPGLVSQEFTVGGEPTAMSPALYESLKKLVPFFPRDPKLAYAVAWTAQRRGNVKDFYHYLRECLRRDPDFCLALLLLARTLAEKQKLNESLFVYKHMKERVMADKSVDMVTLNRLIDGFVEKNGWINFADGEVLDAASFRNAIEQMVSPGTAPAPAASNTPPPVANPPSPTAASATPPPAPPAPVAAAFDPINLFAPPPVAPAAAPSPPAMAAPSPASAAPNSLDIFAPPAPSATPAAEELVEKGSPTSFIAKGSDSVPAADIELGADAGAEMEVEHTSLTRVYKSPKAVAAEPAGASVKAPAPSVALPVKAPVPPQAAASTPPAEATTAPKVTFSPFDSSTPPAAASADLKPALEVGEKTEMFSPMELLGASDRKQGGMGDVKTKVILGRPEDLAEVLTPRADLPVFAPSQPAEAESPQTAEERIEGAATEIFSPMEAVDAGVASRRPYGGAEKANSAAEEIPAAPFEDATMVLPMGFAQESASEPPPVAEEPPPFAMPTTPAASASVSMAPKGFMPIPDQSIASGGGVDEGDGIDLGDDLLNEPTRILVVKSPAEPTVNLARELAEDLKGTTSADAELLLRKSERYIAKRNYYMARKILRHALAIGGDEVKIKDRLRDIRKLELPDSLYSAISSDDGAKEASDEILDRLEKEFDLSPDEEGEEAADLISNIDFQLENIFRETDPRTILDFGVALHEMGLFRQAETVFSRMVDEFPETSFDAYYLAAISKFARKDYAGAASILKTLSTDGGKTEIEKIQVYYTLGELFEKMQRPDSSKEFFKKVAELDANYRNIRHKLEE